MNLFRDRVLYSPGWPSIQYAAKDDLKPLSFLHLLPKFWNYSHGLLGLDFYMVLIAMEPRTLCILNRQSTKKSTYSAVWRLYLWCLFVYVCVCVVHTHMCVSRHRSERGTLGIFCSITHYSLEYRVS